MKKYVGHVSFNTRDLTWNVAVTSQWQGESYYSPEFVSGKKGFASRSDAENAAKKMLELFRNEAQVAADIKGYVVD